MKTYFQNIHYLRQKPNFVLNSLLSLGECFYKIVIKTKNLLYEKNILKENKVDAYVICVGNLTTGGVGKTPIVIELANKIANESKVAVISRGYKSKLSNKKPNVIKDENGIKFKDGTLCGDEPFQLSKKVSKNVIVITCSNRYLASRYAITKYGVKTIILDDGFSNRKLKKDKTILVINSKTRYGNSCLLPKGPLREPISETKRADEIILTDKNDENLDDAINWAKQFNLKVRVCKMTPKKIYNAITKAEIKDINEKGAIAFCAIGQDFQFYNFAKKYYKLAETVSFNDHHEYNKSDINKLIKLALEKDIKTFITTQKDETKLLPLIKEIKGYSFNVLELQNTIEEI